MTCRLDGGMVMTNGSIAFSADVSHIVTVGRDGIITVWPFFLYLVLVLLDCPSFFLGENS